jgi:hypothetical protein
MLVYQIMKQQMQDELDAILTAYKTNMGAGMYQSQFNGQNVDGEFVISYYESMLAGFPPGSTEYETVRSKLDAFRQQYQTDVQNLVIDAMNKGNKIDFGLLGSGFENKGIDEVTLSDVRSWGEGQVAQLLADGDTTQADKLKGAIFVAGFNAENDGKEAAVNNGDLSYATWGKWLGKQLDDALKAGYTKDSEVYRSILLQQSQVNKNAKTEGQNTTYESYKETMSDILSGPDKAAKAILEKFFSANPALRPQVEGLWDNIGATTTPYYSMLQYLAENKGNEMIGGFYDSIMAVGGGDAINEMFSDSVGEANELLAEMIANGFKGVSDDQRADLLKNALESRGNGVFFVANSGIGFSVAAARDAATDFSTSVSTAGAQFDTTADGKQTILGGHPQAISASIVDFGKKIGGTAASAEFQWLSDLGNDRIESSLLPAEFKTFDSNSDGYVSGTEMETGFSSGRFQVNQVQDLMVGVMNNLAMSYLPNSKINAAAVINAYVDSKWGKAAMSAGSVAVVGENGFTTVTAWGKNEVSQDALPTVINMPDGTKTIAYVVPSTIKMTDGQTDADSGLFNGMTVQVYRQGGNWGRPGDFGYGQSMIKITGPMKDAGGNTIPTTSVIVPYSLFSKAASYAGLTLNEANMFSQDANVPKNIVLEFDSQSIGSAKADFWNNVFTNPSSEYHIGNLTTIGLGGVQSLVAPGEKGKTYFFQGSINPGNDMATAARSALTNKSQMQTFANNIAVSKGKTIPDIDDYIDAAVQSIPGIALNNSYMAVRDALAKDSTLLSSIRTAFPSVGVANPLSMGNTVQPSVQSGGSGLGLGGGGFYAPQGTQIRNLPTQSGPSQYSPFLGEAFRNRPTMAPPPAAKPPAVADKPIAQVKATEIKPVQPLKSSTTPTKTSTVPTKTTVTGNSSTATSGFQYLRGVD